MKKIISTVLAALIIILPLAVGIDGHNSADAATEIDYKCGDNATWYLDTDGVLTVSGTGSTYDFNNDAPWELFSESIFSVVFEEGITCIGQAAFQNCKKIKSVHLSASVEKINFNALPNSVEEITVAENSMLTEFKLESDYFKRSEWYINQPADEPIYLGRMLVGVPSSFSPVSVNIKEGTYAVNMNAFKSSSVTEFTFPDSICSVGWGAFEGSSWLEAQPDGPVFAGKVFLKYKGILPVEEINYVIPDGTTGIAGQAFYEQDRLSSIYIPSSVKYIGYDAFNGCTNLTQVNFTDDSSLIEVDYNAFSGCRKLENIALPNSLQIICSGAFNKTAIKNLYIPENVRALYVYYLIGFNSSSSICRYTVDKNNAFFCNDEYGVLYSKDKTILYDYPGCSDLEEYTVDSRCRKIIRGAFYGTSVTISVVINDGCEVIESSQFNSGSVDNVTVPASVTNISPYVGKANYYCYENSAAHILAVEKGYDYVLIDVFTDSDYLEELLSQTQELDRALYTNESLEKLDSAVNNVDFEIDGLTQKQIDSWCGAIEAAIAGLKYKSADYSAVEREIERARQLDMSYYTQVSVIALDEAINSVDYSLDITEQSRVDSYAESIANALNSLVYASVVLRHEPCGVIVSATTKEIKPDTQLAVEEVDSSNYEGTNFAVGGSIRSLHFYDINLVYESAVVQPDGTVTVKIKLAEGVDPAKCKVYHVTEDIVNPLVRFASTIDGNYIVFETDHFSEFAVIEVETVLDRIEIIQMPAKTEYAIGEQLELNDMQVKAYFSDGTYKVVNDYNVSMVNTSSAGSKNVTVYYTFGSITKTAEFVINVSGDRYVVDITENGQSVDRVNKKLSIFALYPRASVQFKCASQHADGCTLRWSSDSSKVLVDENGRVTCKGLFGAKRANITVELIDGSGNVVAEDTVFVVFYKLSFQLSNISSVSDVFKRRFILW